MTIHSALRDLLEPVYRDNVALKQDLHAMQDGYYRLRTAALGQGPTRRQYVNA
jgi:hypothetical protein